MASRIILLLSPVLLLIPGALLATGNRISGLGALVVVSFGVRAVVRLHARHNNRDTDLWGYAALFFPLITPVVLALLPQDPNSPGALLRGDIGASRAKAAQGQFEARFPLLTQTLEGHPEATRAGLAAHFQKAKTNFEFLLPTNPSALTRVVAEAQSRGLITWTGSDGSGPLVYGAGLVPPNGVDEAGNWLASAGAPGKKLTIAHRDGDGILRFIEHRFEKAPEAP
jgi:hypothetical protein